MVEDWHGPWVRMTDKFVKHSTLKKIKCTEPGVTTPQENNCPHDCPAAADIAETLLLLLSLNSSQGVNLPSDPTQAFLALATNFIVSEA